MNLKNLVDFHCHLDLYSDFEKIIQECEQTNIRTLAVTTTPRAWPRNRDLMEKTKYVRPALGFHPQLVDENADRELQTWEKYLHEARYIGEVGIDAGRDFSHSIKEQTRVFERILRCCADAGQKILSVHSVRSASLVLDLIEKNLPADRGGVVLHWFTGSITEAQRAVALGCYFSVNTKMLNTNKGRDLLKIIPSERILTETDGPFNDSDNLPARPKDVAGLVRLLAEIQRTDPHAMAQAISSNLSTLLNK